ncbi:coenzyme F420 hydrogenase [Candidatus Thiomargarita nelsonii]|uniref:Coenzyme F420 hydrogenase n=1 Tax=Candidatus Thiomargarita nelsonii TaxID=1003181 RepID=A0A0A6RUP5_9GAMM|nr:coenzyme F420 hydrogenase [Candidatus Thiomargarita nelsonii]
MLRIDDIRDVAERQLCCGCGICAFINSDSITMVDDLHQGRRPLVMETGDTDIEKTALRVCPGINLGHDSSLNDPALISTLVSDWGPVREVWEGFASDTELRYAGSSGGVVSALALYGIEGGKMHGVLHTAARSDVPYLNHTVLSTTRHEIQSATGSRYAPASPCDGLQKIVDAPAPCVFIGKPCDVAAVQKARKCRPDLDEKVGLTIAIFCAGTPTTAGTLALLEKFGVTDPGRLQSIRYRGNGWPGRAYCVFENAEGQQEDSSMTYATSWGSILSNYQQWRCNICADHTGEFADIAVGDPWYREISSDDPGRSLVLARTELGRQFMNEAMANGYLTMERGAAEILPASQPNLLQTRGAVWGRLLALRLVGVAVPNMRGMPLFHIWLKHLSFSQKIKSLLGTIRRVFRRRLWHRHPVKRFE